MSGTTEPAHLFVYGTLRSGSGHPMRQVLARCGTLSAPASVPARLLDLGRYPGAVPDDEGARVQGEVWLLADRAGALTELDAYEGCGPADDPPHDFRRARVDARLASGGTLPCWIYWYEGTRRGRPIESGDWLDTRPACP